jgi:hypothetical protein
MRRRTGRVGRSPLARPGTPDTPRREIAVGMIGRRSPVFALVGAPHVDKAVAREAGRRPPGTSPATIR